MGTLDIFIGITLAVSGNIFQSVGFIIQKYAHNQVNKINADIPKDKQKSVLSQYIWWIGILVYLIGGISNTIALNFAAQSIIAPFNGLFLAMIAILSHFILKELLKVKDVIAIIVIVCGIVMVVYFGPSDDNNKDITIDELRVYFESIPYIITIITLAVLTASSYIGVKYVERKNFETDNNNEITFGSNFLLFSYTYIAAFFSSNNVLLIKALVLIVGPSLTSMDNLKTNATDYLSYIIIVLYFICLVLTEYFRAKALSHFGALMVVPIFSVTYICMTAVVGMIYFEEYNNFTVVNAVLFAIGILGTISGVLILALDIAKIWTQLYDKNIKVAFVDYNQCNNKYAQMVVVGGPLSEYAHNYFLKHHSVCYNDAAARMITNQNVVQITTKTKLSKTTVVADAISIRLRYRASKYILMTSDHLL